MIDHRKNATMSLSVASDETRAAAGRCALCGELSYAMHAIFDARLWESMPAPDSNSVPLCAHHLAACEKDEIDPQELCAQAGLSLALPDQLYDWLRYDRWGNPYFADGTRSKGELFGEPDVRKTLSTLGRLPLFSSHVRYPRTFVLPWTEAMSKGDRRLASLDALEATEVVATEKLDGQNVTLYRDMVMFRNIAARTHPSRAWLDRFWEARRHRIPDGWRVCGEYVFISHFVTYTELESYFIGFSVWNDANTCLSWSDTVRFLDELDIARARVLYAGPCCPPSIHAAWIEHGACQSEGYVVRTAGAISLRQFKTHVGKFIRDGYVQRDPLTAAETAAGVKVNGLGTAVGLTTTESEFVVDAPVAVI